MELQNYHLQNLLFPSISSNLSMITNLLISYISAETYLSVSVSVLYESLSSKITKFNTHSNHEK